MQAVEVGLNHAITTGVHVLTLLVDRVEAVLVALGATRT
jgi:hypothetical protein